MSSMNKVLLVGRLKAEPITIDSNTTFQIITSNKWRDKNNTLREKIETHNILATAKKSKICQNHLTKGDKVMIEGELQTNKLGKTEVVVKAVFLLSYSKKNRSEEPPEDDEIDA